MTQPIAGPSSEPLKQDKTAPASDSASVSLLSDDERDAKRYRWLRADLVSLDAKTEFPGLYEGCPDGHLITPQNFDAAIDAAISATTKEN